MATPVFCCGFECGVTSAGTLNDSSHWLAAGFNNASFSTSIKRNGNRSLRINPTAAVGGARSTAIVSANIKVLRVFIYFTTLPTTDFGIIGCLAGNVYGAMFKQSDNSIYAGNHDSGTTFSFGSTGVPVTTNRWYKIDIRTNTGANPRTVEVSVDGVACGQYSLAIAGQTAGDIIVGVVGQTTTADFYLDDLLLSHTTGDYPLTDGKIEPYIAVADGAHNVASSADFQRGNTGVDITNATTTAYQLIDDVPLKSSANNADNIAAIAPVNATDYVEVLFGAAPGFAAPVIPPSTVAALVGYHQAGTQTGNLRIALNDNGTTNDIVFITAAGVTTIRYNVKQYTDPPSAASAWTLSGNGNFNNVRMRFYSSDAAPDQYFETAMLEAEFEQPKQKIVQVKQAVNRASTY